ncbi:MAG: acyl-CoA desaturase [Rhodospirillaceae bacterium]|nr:acyl-CoA desaturase [Rhodospirillaceae bacterium]
MHFTEPNAFFATVRARVDEHFAGANRRDDPRLYRKAAIIGLWFTGSYALLLTTESAFLRALLCVSFAFSAGALGFNVFHDAVHGSFSSSRRTNLLLSHLTCAVLGTGRYFWWYKHNVLHHHYTNIFEWDDDIETRGSLRLSPRQPWQPKFRHQHVWFGFAYSLATIEWLFIKDFVQYFSLRMNSYQAIPGMSSGEKWEFWSAKAFYLALFVGLPFALFPAGQVVIGLLIFHVILSLVLTLVFNLAHAIEKAEFPAPCSGTFCINDEWAAHQLRTTVNFATSNHVLNWFSGGLNFQIEHHLFPQISHTHYPAISAIVRRTAQEHGLPYNLYETYRETVVSHFRTLRTLAAKPV